MPADASRRIASADPVTPHVPHPPEGAEFSAAASARARSGDLSGAAWLDGPHLDPSLPQAERAYRMLRDRLVMLDLMPGEPLHEAALIDELGFGRTPIREAIKRLEVDHLVVTYPRRGTFAAPVDITELAMIGEVRELLEPHASERAAMLRGDREREGMERILEQMAQPDLGTDGSPRALMRLDMGLHRMVYRAAQNPYLEETLIRYDNLATRIWCVVMHRLDGIAVHVEEHAELLRAILDGEPAQARAIATDHVEHFGRVLREAL